MKNIALVVQLLVGLIYRATLCYGPVSVYVCVCLSQVGVLLKRLNTGSHEQNHTIAHEL